MQESPNNPSFYTGAPQAQQPAAPPQNAGQVYTMPDRFQGGGTGSPKQGGSKRWILWTVAGIVIVAGAGFGSYFLFQNLPGTATNASNENTAVANTTNTNRTANANASTNTDGGFSTNTSNANAPTNAAANVNATNGNTNAAVNTNTAANTNTTANTNTAPAQAKPLPSSLDSDSDGLTDMEETQIYTTDPNKPDTDGDGFIDGKQVTASGVVGEVALGYHPNGGGRLSASTLVKTYENSAYTYKVLYPATWGVTETDSLKKSILISPPSTTSTGEFFQISIQENASQVTPKEWYINLNPGIDPALVEEITVNGILGVVSLDGQTIYLGKGNLVYIVTYNSGTLTQLNFHTTFEMLYQNFLLTGPITNS